MSWRSSWSWSRRSKYSSHSWQQAKGTGGTTFFPDKLWHMNWATARETCWTTASSCIYARDSRYLSKLQQQQQLLLLLPTSHDSSQSKDLLPSHMYACLHLSQAFKDLVTTSITCLFHNMTWSSHNLRICLLPPQLWVKLNSPAASTPS
jgi:hypothetical protein